jgi:hypothetical protein
MMLSKNIVIFLLNISSTQMAQRGLKCICLGKYYCLKYFLIYSNLKIK